jgi:hypothetical protein
MGHLNERRQTALRAMDRSPMQVVFSKGVLQSELGSEYPASWARTPFGIMSLVPGEDEALEFMEEARVVSEKPIAKVDLPGLDRDHIDEIVRSVLAGGFLDKPGIEGKGDAVIFALVNEALHRLDQIAADERL